MQHIINYEDNKLSNRKVLNLISGEYIPGRPIAAKILVSYHLDCGTHKTPLVRIETITIFPEDPLYGIAINLNHLNDSFSKLFIQ